MEAFDLMIGKCKILHVRNSRALELQALANRYPQCVRYDPNKDTVIVKHDICTLYINAKLRTYIFCALTNPDPTVRELFYFDTTELSHGLNLCTELITKERKNLGIENS